MIKKYVDRIANQMEVELSMVSIINSQFLGSHEISLVKLTAKDHHANVLVHKFELDEIEKGDCCHTLDMRVRTTLSLLFMN
jgi:hypothetical protein